MKFLTHDIARVLFALPFFIFGINHFRFADSMSEIVPVYVPGSGVMWVYATGAAFILASISILTKHKIRLACLLLALMLTVFVVAIHLPKLSDPDAAQMALVQLLKDTSLAGASLLFAGAFGKRGA